MWSEDLVRSLTFESASGGVIRETPPALANWNRPEIAVKMLKFGLKSSQPQSQNCYLLANALRELCRAATCREAVSALT